MHPPRRLTNMRTFFILTFLIFTAFAKSSRGFRGSKIGAAVSASRSSLSKSSQISKPSPPRISKPISIQKPKVIIPAPVVVKQKMVLPKYVVYPPVLSPHAPHSYLGASGSYVESRLASIERQLTTPRTTTPSIEKKIQDVLDRQTTTVPTTTTTTEIAVEDLFLKGCPTRVDAFVEGKNISYLFQGSKVFTLINPTDPSGRYSVERSQQINEIFQLTNRVTSAVYNPNWKKMVLFTYRKMYKIYADLWVEDSFAPKELDDSISFIPTGAIWHNNQIVLFSDNRDFAILDAIYNKAELTGKNYHGGEKSLSSQIRGYSALKDVVFTPREVFHFNQTTVNNLHERLLLKNIINCDLDASLSTKNS